MTAAKTAKITKNPHTQSDWENWYKARTGCEDLRLHPEEIVLYHTEHGFVTFLTHDDVLELHHLCGDGKYWQKVILNVMKFEKLKKLNAFTRRNPKAWAKKYGGHIRGYYMECDIDELKI